MRFDSSRFLSFVPMVNMTPAEHVAARTWSTLRRAKQLRVRFGEETLTDLLVLDMLPYQHTKGFWLDPLTKHHEGRYGADLLVAVRHQTGNGSLLALQAKKLYPDDRYQMFEPGDRVPRSIGQARRVRAAVLRPAPLLALQPLEYRTFRALALFASSLSPEPQLGCTLVPSGAHSKHALPPPAPSGFPLGPQDQTGQTMVLCFRLSVRRERTAPNGLAHSSALPWHTASGRSKLPVLRTEGGCLALNGCFRFLGHS